MRVDPETTFDQYYGVPQHLRSALVRYVNDHDTVGDFLTAVLENNLRGAMMFADIESRAGLYALVKWLFNEVPSTCWGSEEAVKVWIAIKPAIPGL